VDKKTSLLSVKARNIAPYTAGEQPRGGAFIKLNTNENPYPPSPSVLRAAASFDYGRFRKYPDIEASVLRDLIASRNGLSPGNIVCGNGSDEILAFCFQAFFDTADGEAVYFPDITYSFYKVWCGLYSLNYFTPPVDVNFEIDTADYCNNGQLKDKPRPAGVALANPNAPTGIVKPVSEIEKIIAANPETVVIVDEAYGAFSNETCLPLIKKYKNLCVVQTFSKSYSMAGLRVGFAAADPALIDGIKKIRDSFNSYPLDCFAAEMSAAAYADGAYLKKTADKIIRTREKLSADLRKIGFTVLPSGANFVFVNKPGVSGEALCAGLRSSGILVRRFAEPRIADWLRITIGTTAETSKVSEALKLLTSRPSFQSKNDTNSL